MIIYAPEPFNIIASDEGLKTIDIKLPNGGIVQAIPWGVNQIKIINIVSTDPSDYLNGQYMPGRILTMNARLDD